jgi:DNA-directed RNA polymerase sigma subunit (sigma70/sigma32)
MTSKEIAQKRGVSRQAIDYLEGVALEKLRNYARQEGLF